MPHTQQSAHLSDTDIDAYWSGGLAETDQQRVEVHFLECAECRERVAAVETLIDALRLEPTPAAHSGVPVRVWQMAAAVFLIVAVGATWQWMRLARVTPPSAVSAQTDGGPVSTMRVGIEPPTRSAAATSLTVPTGVAIVVFDLDAREAGAPGSAFDVSLAGPDGRLLLRVETRSSSTGRIQIPIHRGLLSPGQFVFEVARDRTIVALPVVINGPNPP